ncbi:MAG TPA: hypothetical protein VEK78_03580 [Gemmatimonadales bacterium]|nr:hypothetical protein [Gemmatimonadales bacterium]
MKATRVLLATLLGGGLVLAALSCADPSPLGVRSRAPVPQASLGDLLGSLTGVVPCSPLPADSVTQTIGPEGGTLQVGPHTLSVPAGALDAPVTITAVAPSDTVRRVHFEPAGLTFQEPASLTMSYAGCDPGSVPLPKRIVFTTDLLQIIEYLQSVDSRPSDTVTGRLQHFSDYAIAW